MSSKFAPLLLLLGLAAGIAAAEPLVEVHKDPTCGCCGKWIEHLRAEGFTVHVTDTGDLAAVKRGAGVPAELGSCHTAMVDGYVIEGHVPAADVRRLLAERPAVRGLAVPGMPLGAPGMDYDGRRQPYATIAFDADGRQTVFQQH